MHFLEDATTRANSLFKNLEGLIKVCLMIQPLQL